MKRNYNPQFEKIGDILVFEEYITETDLKRALEEQKTSKDKLGRILIQQGAIDEDTLVKAYSLQLGYKAVNEDDLLKATEDVVRLIPEDFAMESEILALARTDHSIVVAMEDPEDLVALDELKKMTNLTPEVVVAGKTALKRAIEQLYSNIKKTGEVEEVLSGIRVISGDDEEEEEIDLSPEKVSAEEAPIVKLVNMILEQAIKERATDVHIEPQTDHVKVRIRIDGVLMQILTPPASSHSGITTRIKIMSKLNIAERRLPQDGRFTIKTSDREIDVRVSVLPTVFGEKIVMRLLDKGDFSMDLTTLGFRSTDLRVFRRWITQPYGMVIISGPTGSGKSTTLYAALKEIKSEGTNITTVEDPVEYQLEGINQVQVKEDIGLTFGSTLRSVLRQDPDILLIGEIRDAETADIAVKFSLTGHLVFSTVHANDAPSTITRLVDIGVPPFLAGSCLNLIMAQRLVRKICPQCKEEYIPTTEEIDRLGIKDTEYEDKTFYQGKGCLHCRRTGYYGRTGIFEILEVRQPIRNLIFSSANEDAIRDKSKELGMNLLRENGIKAAVQGTTTIHEVFRSTVEEF